jgi:hypothetical protein
MPKKLIYKITIKSGFVNNGRLINTFDMTANEISIEVYLFQNVKRGNHITR